MMGAAGRLPYIGSRPDGRHSSRTSSGERARRMEAARRSLRTLFGAGGDSRGGGGDGTRTLRPRPRRWRPASGRRSRRRAPPRGSVPAVRAAAAAARRLKEARRRRAGRRIGRRERARGSATVSAAMGHAAAAEVAVEARAEAARAVARAAARRRRKPPPSFAHTEAEAAEVEWWRRRFRVPPVELTARAAALKVLTPVLLLLASLTCLLSLQLTFAHRTRLRR